MPEDSLPFSVAQKLADKLPEIKFIPVKPNEDLPFAGEKQVVIMDTVAGIDKAEVIGDDKLDEILLSPSISIHDFDLGFQLKYLKKIGKLGKVTIVALPQGKKPDYFSIQSIFKKLVAQDMQGS